MEKTAEINSSVGSILRNTGKAALGLVAFGAGEYLTIQADLGTAPWDTLNMGLHRTLGIRFGTAAVAVSLLILVIDALMREPIGIGMILDAFIVGKTIDLLNWLEPVSCPEKPVAGVAMMLAGIVIMGFSQAAYMGAALCCGPRDTLLVGLKKRLRRVPIGAISVVMLSAVTLAGWLLGGTVGVGTLIAAFLIGPVMQAAFRMVHFDPTAVKHQNLAESLRVIIGKKGGERP